MSAPLDDIVDWHPLFRITNTSHPISAIIASLQRAFSSTRPIWTVSWKMFAGNGSDHEGCLTMEIAASEQVAQR
jgi:hypothetical protein